MPRNAIVVLLDSLNRHLLGAYGGTEFDTPHLDRFARRALRFEQHYSGSLPCMPARHDILCGSLDFLWKPWGSIEIWETAIPYPLRAAGVTTQLISDHPHLFETGGENYHTDFTAWDYQRGGESDAWKTVADPSFAGAPTFGRPENLPYHRSRGWFRGEEDFPGPRTMRAARRWLDENVGHHERFLLFIDEFDPHEPFDAPEPYLRRYDPDWEGPHLIWPPYAIDAVARGVLSEREARQVRACYGGKLALIDHWFGTLVDAIDRHALWDDTLVIVCTDHGHYLGEKDSFGKPPLPIYEPLGHTPLLVAWPGIAPRSVDALTTNVDLFATLADLFGVEVEQRTHGFSLAPLIRGQTESVRDYALAGVWGREVHYLDGRFKYARAPVGPNAPLSMWSNRWSTMPVHLPVPRELLLPPPDDRARLDHMPGSRIPVLRQPWDAGDRVPYWARAPFRGTCLYEPREDPAEERNLVGGPEERRMASRLREALRDLEAPEDQLSRLFG
ncbi:MAG: sulfatase-like hydrolase/transferase [Myxococcota bacterium]